MAVTSSRRDVLHFGYGTGPLPRPIGHIMRFDLAECSEEVSRGSDENKRAVEGS